MDKNLDLHIEGTYLIVVDDYRIYLDDSKNESEYKILSTFKDVDIRTGEFATWVQTSPQNGAWCFKFDTSNFRQVPPLANLMKGCIDNEEIGC